MKSYSELIQFETIEERFEYLALHGTVAQTTFGHERWINQQFYTSSEWRNIRQFVIVRDNGCDLGVPGFILHEPPLIHHMNPMTVGHIVDGDTSILDPENLITVSHRTHNAIHYGNKALLPKDYVPRQPGDTKFW